MALSWFRSSLSVRELSVSRGAHPNYAKPAPSLFGEGLGMGLPFGIDMNLYRWYKLFACVRVIFNKNLKFNLWQTDYQIQ